MTGEALELRLRLRRLMAEHRVVHEPCSLPMTAPTLCPQILEGLAMTSDIDADRCRFRPFAFGMLRGRVPLLFKHDPNQVAGQIESWGYDPRGNLRVCARVDHPLARRCGGFSVGGRVISYKMHNVDCENFFAEVDDAELSEISLTDRPSNRNALVTRRYPASSLPKFFDLQIARLECLKQMLALLPQVMACPRLDRGAAAEAPPAPMPSRVQHLHKTNTDNISIRPTSFGSMVQQLNARSEA
jgi:hypothetical protein